MLFFLLLLTISCTFANDASRIVGGLPASEGQFKYLAQLKYVVDGHDLGTYTGSIISDQWILTSALVYINAKPEELTAIVGTTQIDNESGWAYDVSDIIAHPNRTTMTDINNNIAVVKVKGHIMLGENVATIMLSSATRIPPNVLLNYAAWGAVNSSKSTNSPTLQHISLNTMTKAWCRKLLPQHAFDNSSYFCAVPPGTRQGPCYGDTGAPVVYDSYQIGLDVLSVSCYGEEQAIDEMPTVFLMIGVYIDWIEEVTGVEARVHKIV